MLKRQVYGVLLLVFCCLLFLPGCPYQSGALSARYWDESIRETNQDLDDVLGARDHR